MEGVSWPLLEGKERKKTHREAQSERAHSRYLGDRACLEIRLLHMYLSLSQTSHTPHVKHHMSNTCQAGSSLLATPARQLRRQKVAVPAALVSSEGGATLNTASSSGGSNAAAVEVYFVAEGVTVQAVPGDNLYEVGGGTPIHSGRFPNCGTSRYPPQQPFLGGGKGQGSQGLPNNWPLLLARWRWPRAWTSPSAAAPAAAASARSRCGSCRRGRRARTPRPRWSAPASRACRPATPGWRSICWTTKSGAWTALIPDQQSQ